MEKKRLVIFLCTTFGLTWGDMAALYFGGLSGNAAAVQITFMLAMFCPSIGVLVARLTTKEGFKNALLLPKIKGNVRSYIVAWLLPGVLVLAGMAVYFIVMPQMYDTEYELITQLIGDSVGVSPAAFIGVQILQALLLSAFLNLMPCFGEEWGWRGYLLPKLCAKMSTWKAILLTGAIWGIWHAPMIAMGHNYGTQYIGYPWLGIIGMTVFCMAFGSILSYLTLKTKSIYPAAMAHGAVNGIASIGVYLCKPGYNPLIGPMPMGVLGGSAILVAGIVFFLLARKKTFDTLTPPAEAEPVQVSAEK